MKKSLMCLHVFFLCTLILVVSTPPAVSASVRKPAWSGKFYPGDKTTLTSSIRDLTLQAKTSSPELPEKSGKLRALIMPHAGYIYSGLTAAHASHVLHRNQFSRVLLLGVDHRVGFRNCAISVKKTWSTPLKSTRIHPDARLLSIQNPAMFSPVPESEASEHSLEVILPFLQYYLDTFELIPVTVGRCDPKDVAGAFGDITGIINDPESLIVASTDLSHYLPYRDAVSRDRQTIDLIMNFDIETLKKKDNSACGMMPVLTLLEIAKSSGWKPCLLHYSNSGDTQGDKTRVVGYTTIAFYGGESMNSTTQTKQFNTVQGDVLLKLARSTISEKLGRKKSPVDIPGDDIFSTQRGTFVTLKINNQLRGCIGNLASDTTVVEGVKRNALNAAFSDYRFKPLSPEELDSVEIEVSILTEPKELSHSGGKDLTSRLRPGIDGVIIKMGSAGATFLPQVWEQLPDPAEFLGHLCRKAGIPSDTWMSSELEVSTYQVQYFEEHD